LIPPFGLVRQINSKGFQGVFSIVLENKKDIGGIPPTSKSIEPLFPAFCSRFFFEKKTSQTSLADKLSFASINGRVSFFHRSYDSKEKSA
ncbi:hypothetical protein, partial [Enterococcus sp. LJL51]|uniref:hypothetical protein n=1 Tax=Enterococcus sp. LJL51 TaxID=3416656 RepID=UPI003CEB3421